MQLVCFLLSPWMIIDLAAILPFYIEVGSTLRTLILIPHTQAQAETSLSPSPHALDYNHCAPTPPKTTTTLAPRQHEATR